MNISNENRNHCQRCTHKYNALIDSGKFNFKQKLTGVLSGQGWKLYYQMIACDLKANQKEADQGNRAADQKSLFAHYLAAYIAYL